MRCIAISACSILHPDRGRDSRAAAKGTSMAAIRVRIGTRKSAMALAQTAEIARGLAAGAPEAGVEIVKFETTGDTDQVGKLLPHGGTGGRFVAEIGKTGLYGEMQAET